MKLYEIFDREAAIADFDMSVEQPTDTNTSEGDMIISRFEMGEISYDDAKSELIRTNNEVWITELNMAAELKVSKGNLN